MFKGRLEGWEKLGRCIYGPSMNSSGQGSESLWHDRKKPEKKFGGITVGQCISTPPFHFFFNVLIIQ